jgi:hypothetical protein
MDVIYERPHYLKQKLKNISKLTEEIPKKYTIPVIISPVKNKNLYISTNDVT